MSAPLLAIDSHSDFPLEADSVVIGGGIVGASAAYWLARAGQKVVLLEKGRIGAEQSSRNWGWCRQQNRDARELALAGHSLAIWESMAADIGESLGFSRCGLLFLSNDDAELEAWGKWGRFAIGEGVVTQMLSSVQASERGRATGQRWKGGVWSARDGIADPARAVPVIAKGVIKHGGIVVQGCAVRGLERQAGAVSGVITERGVIRTGNVVLAGGAWASSFLHQLGIRFPQASVRCSILSLMPGAEGMPDALFTKRATVTRRGDGGYTLAISQSAHVDPTPGLLSEARHFLPMFAKRWRVVSPGGLEGWRSEFETRQRWALDRPTPMERIRILNPKPSHTVLKQVLARARHLLPGLAQVPVQATWAGYVDSTPDGVPVIDGDIGIPGLVLAAGCSGHGFCLGPGMGRLAADLSLGRSPIVDPKTFRLARFGGAQWGKVSEF